jgi:hypothetical protein
MRAIAAMAEELRAEDMMGRHHRHLAAEAGVVNDVFHDPRDRRPRDERDQTERLMARP